MRGLTCAGNCDARDAKIKRVASDQRLKDMEMAHAASLNSSEGGLPSASQLAGNAGHLSASHLSAAAADADQVGVCGDVCGSTGRRGKGGTELCGAQQLWTELCGAQERARDMRHCN